MMARGFWVTSLKWSGNSGNLHVKNGGNTNRKRGNAKNGPRTGKTENGRKQNKLEENTKIANKMKEYIKKR